MRRDQVMAMTDEELRVRGAELLGYTEIKDRDLPVPWLMDLCENVLSGFLDGKLCVVKDYPNDIAAAWELVDLVGDAEVTIQTITEDMITADEADPPECSEVNFDLGVNLEWPESMICESRRGNESWALTTARAATRAFILAMEAKE